jgi:nucleotidyltransferase/DNA polymerase involved in DNA repair
MKMTLSVGIAPNKMLSKICSEINKPDGMKYLPFDKQKIHEFMKERKIRDIPGIGSTMQ